MTTRWTTLFSRAFFVAAAALLGAGIAVDTGPGRALASGGDLIVEEPRKSFGTAPGGEHFEVGIALANRSSRPIRILGGDFNCSKEGCVKVVGLPWTIPPNGRRELKILVKTRAPGVFKSEVTVFTDCNSKQRFQVGIDGIVVTSS